jgi:hypothetical protein
MNKLKKFLAWLGITILLMVGLLICFILGSPPITWIALGIIASGEIIITIVIIKI